MDLGGAEDIKILGRGGKNTQKNYTKKTRWLDDITDSTDLSLSASERWCGQGSLVCCRPWGLNALDTTEQLNDNAQQRTCNVLRLELTQTFNIFPH